MALSQLKGSANGVGWLITSSKQFRLPFATSLTDKSHSRKIFIGRPIDQLLYVAGLTAEVKLSFKSAGQI